MSVKILEISACFQCHYLRRFNAFIYECQKEKIISMDRDQTFGMPKECPLPERVETGTGFFRYNTDSQ